MNDILYEKIYYRKRYIIWKDILNEKIYYYMRKYIIGKDILPKWEDILYGEIYYINRYILGKIHGYISKFLTDEWGFLFSLIKLEIFSKFFVYSWQFYS